MPALCHSSLETILSSIPHTTYLKTIVRLSPYHPSPSSTHVAFPQTILLNTLVPSQPFYQSSYTTSITQSLLNFLFKPHLLAHITHTTLHTSLLFPILGQPFKTSFSFSLSITSLVNAPSPFPPPPTHTRKTKPIHPGPTYIPWL